MDPKHIFGLHEPGGEWLITEAGRGAWIVTTHELGHNPENRSGYDYRTLSSQGLGVIARLNHGYGEAGTVPVPEQYAAFAQRVGNFVANSQGCHVWIIGNEPNHGQERPYGMVILPGDYAECYVQCYDAIHELPGHEDDQVVLAAVAPWNNQTTYEGNEGGDWIEYFVDLFWEIAMWDGDVDAIALHAYTHGTAPALVFSEARMDPPFEARRYEFRAYREFMEAIPLELRHAPVYITETDEGDPWENGNRGWVQNAYREIQHWNNGVGHQQIRALALYRWPPYDEWSIEGKEGVYEDFRAAMEHDYRWRETMNEGWERVYYDGLEQGFYDQDGVDELTLPVKHRVKWDPARPCPEMDSKRASAGHSEIYEGQYSAVGFLPYAKFRWWVYTTQPIAVDRGKRTRASVQVMVVSHGMEGDPSKAGDCGMRSGLSPATTEDPESPTIVWSSWHGVRDTLANERIWVKVQTAELIPQVDAVRLWIQCNADLAADISAGHWDEEIVEQYGEASPPPPPPPPPGEYHTMRVVVEIDGETWIDTSEQFTAQASGVTLARVAGGSLMANVWRRVSALAQRIGGG